MKRHIARLNFSGDPNLGLFTVPTDDICFVGQTLSSKAIETIRDVLKVEVVKASVAGSDIIGIFSTANKNGIVLPKIAEKEEIDFFKKLGLNVFVPKVKQTALGNLILVNDNGCLIPKEIKSTKKDLQDCFGVPVEICNIVGLIILGSCAVATNQGVLVHRNCTEKEMELLEKVLGVRGDIGTVNFGSPFVGAALVANSKGFLISDQTTGPELQRCDEALGFI